ncbi:hypothetical protein GWI33_019977 [Rhynchophorus ferrugineus]|uniref:Uncharacterized protein n=1 Tax=Rhynchophorus ferrugineus TaxID=354439 RepID=A0A834HSG1_RHYFE|nr:hypothetical protein GWI33_019977 [Rhynchophorus ferrugineus]
MATWPQTHTCASESDELIVVEDIYNIDGIHPVLSILDVWPEPITVIFVIGLGTNTKRRENGTESGIIGFRIDEKDDFVTQSFFSSLSRFFDLVSWRLTTPSADISFIFDPGPDAVTNNRMISHRE